MKREYRIFDKVEKMYCEEPDFRWMLSRKGKLYNSENDEWHDLGERYIVEFATGLHDKNEKEIYDGDRCKTYQIGIGNLIQTVSFDNGSFILQHEYQIPTELRGFKQDFIEVIGNIHETLH